MDIEAIWVIEPKQRRYYRYRDGQLSPCAVFELPGSTFRVALTEIETRRWVLRHSPFSFFAHYSLAGNSIRTQ